MKVAIVILNWNGRQFLESYLPTLLEHTPPKLGKVIVADNASTDDSLAFLREKHPHINVISLGKNHGFAGGYNRALEQLEADYFLLLNSDIEVSPGWLEPLVELLDSHADIAACAPVLMDIHKRDHYEYAGAAGGYIDRYGYAFCRGRIFNQVAPTEQTFNKPVEVLWTTGAAMMIRSDIWKKMGGLDDQFFAHMEEIDLCWRMRNKGYKLAVEPASRVFHVGGGTLPKSNPFKTYLNFRNNLLMLHKNLPSKSRRSILQTRIWMDGLSALLFLVQFKFKDIAAIAKAHRDFRSMRKTYTIENEIKGMPEEVYQGALVVDHFLLGKKRFEQLRKGFPQKMNQKIIESR